MSPAVRMRAHSAGAKFVSGKAQLTNQSIHPSKPGTAKRFLLWPKTMVLCAWQAANSFKTSRARLIVAHANMSYTVCNMPRHSMLPGFASSEFHSLTLLFAVQTCKNNNVGRNK